LIVRFGTRRFGAVIALAGAAVLATSGIALADSESGQHGHYVFKDDPGTVGATCVYAAVSPGYKLTSIVVKPASLWWPDTNSGNNREHGKVGWRLSLQISEPGAYGPWHTLFNAPTQIKQAYEDQPAYDPADRANLAKMTLDVNGGYRKKPDAHARVVHTAYWYAGDSSVMGTVTHEQFYYRIAGVPGHTELTTACPIHLISE
jgi:hypothetical protein